MKPMFWRKYHPEGTSRRLTKLPLAGEITIVLIVKVALITLLSRTFFAHPQAEHMRMPTASVEQRLLTPARAEDTPGAHHTSEAISTPE